MGPINRMILLPRRRLGIQRRLLPEPEADHEFAGRTHEFADRASESHATSVERRDADPTGTESVIERSAVR